MLRGIVLGVHTGKDQDKYELTSFAKRYDESIGGKLSESLKISGPPKPNQCRVYWGLNKEYEAYAVVGIGDPKTVSKLECINAEKEVIRAAAAVGVNTLVAQNVLDIEVESLGGAECTAVGALLGTFKYQDLKAKDKRSPKPKIQLRSDSDDADGWKRGKILANAQNYTRVLMETPANLMTPTIFAEKVKNHFQKCNIDVKIEAHDADWARELGMNAFLSVASGSDQPPVFLEMTYSKGKSDDPFICLVGKGVTFDSGGISIKPAAGMADMRADMGGAANLVGALAAISQLKLPVNVKALIPLTENLINGHATKPGDVVRAMNGKTICVDNTDAEGRLILADALCYAERFKPKFILDIATLTGAIIVALGNCVAAAYCTDESLWKNLEAAGADTGDRMWRMPLFSNYNKMVTDYESYDLQNTGKKGAGSCTAAAFLREFVPENTPWIHIDMAGMMTACDDQLYTNGKMMPGRPMRTLVELVQRYAQNKQ
ncbi:cytosol aminopeptidase-like isoform X4 [Hermetia illucens]|uniref:cytosol aminopeptidase-like isoform X4 n=1 Tax=Hermetia illucens TaxID=343691 RepID=UPI0018CC12B3|nr:cytosol aminopeptidase-like isoform X4 [Hermetia illucens]